MKMRKTIRNTVLSVLVFLLTMSMGAVTYPFPQNISYGNGYQYGTAANNSIKTSFETWWGNFYTESGDYARIKWTTSSQTVSEGVGYGMLMAVYMSDNSKSYEAEFKKLWNYYKKFSNNNGLMNWKVDGFSNVSGENGATDAEMDVAISLVMAYYQFGDSYYLGEAKTLIENIRNYEVSSNSLLKPGDAWEDRRNPSYISVAALEIFDQLAYGGDWSSIISANYSLLSKVQSKSSANLFADWCDDNGNTIAHWDGTTAMGYDGARTPWRVQWDYYWFGNSNAKSLMESMYDSAVKNTSASSVKGIINLNGSFAGTDVNASFVGAYAMAAAAGSQDKVNEYFKALVSLPSHNTDYFNGSLRVIYMMMLSGNMPNLKALSEGGGGTTSGTTSGTTTSGTTSGTTTSGVLIEDFYDSQINITGFFPAEHDSMRGYWYTYADEYGTTISPVPNSQSAIENAFTTGNGSVKVNFNITDNLGTDEYPYSGFGFDFYNYEGQEVADLVKKTVDLSGYTGLTVTYSSDIDVSIEMGEARTADGAEYACLLFSTGGETSTATCTWADFTRPGWAEELDQGSPSVPKSAVTGFKFSYKVKGTTGYINLSEVRLDGSGVAYAVDKDNNLIGGTTSGTTTSGAIDAIDNTKVINDLSVLFMNNELTLTVNQSGPYEVNLYSMIGNKVATLLNGNLSQGVHSISLANKNLPKGIYIAKVQQGVKILTFKIAIR